MVLSTRICIILNILSPRQTEKESLCSRTHWMLMKHYSVENIRLVWDAGVIYLIINVEKQVCCTTQPIKSFCLPLGRVMWNGVTVVQDSLLRHVMKQSVQLLLFFLVVWMVLFLAVFAYFTDSQANQSQKAISISYSEGQHVAQESREFNKAYSRKVAERRGPIQSRREFKDSDSRANWLQFRNIFKKRLERRVMLRSEGTINSRSLVEGLWKGNVSSNMLNRRLQQVMKEYVRLNKHNVLYKGKRNASRSGQELLCQMKQQAWLKTLDGSEQPFSRLGFQHLFPSQPLQKLYKTCAVVSSAGSILNSLMGQEIGELDSTKNKICKSLLGIKFFQ